MLAELVRGGKLPPLSERLPKRPMAIEQVDQTGEYGGTWNRVIPTPDTDLNNVIGYTALVRWDTAWKEIVPDVAESFEISDDGTEYTFKLREGLRWSDGTPFSADDVVFAIDDVMLNAELAPAPSTRLISGGKPGRVEKVDKYTVRFTFAAPNGQFLMSIASMRVPATSNPAHYMKQFHKKYNPNIDQLVKKEGFDDWTELYRGKGGDIFGTPASYYQNEHMPTLNAWRMTTPVGHGTRALAERNPYYWKVDSEGRQLPYIDSVAFTLVQDPEVMVLKAQNGEIGMQAEYFNTLANKPVLARTREKGGYRFFNLIESSMNTMLIAFNLTHKDPVKREVFRAKDFRIGLSYAINRQEIIDLLYKGKGKPWQAAPRPESPLYDEEFATQYTDYDIDKANSLLDKAGYSKRDGQGRRLGPDGQPISFRLEFPSTTVEYSDAAELIKKYWKRVGIEVSPRSEGPSLFSNRVEANDLDAGFDGYGQGLLYDILLEPNPYFPFGSESYFAYAWGQWAIGFRTGLAEEPPPAAKRQIDLYANKVLGTNDIDEQIDLMKEVIRIAREEFWQLGVMLPSEGYSYGIAGNNFHNTPATMISAGDYYDPGPTYPEQYTVDRS